MRKTTAAIGGLALLAVGLVLFLYLTGRPSELACRDGETLAAAVRAYAAGDAAEARRLFRGLPADSGRLAAAMDAGPLGGLRHDDSWGRVLLGAVGVGDPAGSVQEALDAAGLFREVARSPSPEDVAILRALLAPLQETDRYQLLNDVAKAIEGHLDARPVAGGNALPR